LVTLANLRAQTSKELARLARNEGVTGWHSMRKEQLVQAILKLARRRSVPLQSRGDGDLNGRSHANRIDAGEQQVKSAVAARLELEHRKSEALKNLARDSYQKNQSVRPQRDRLVLIVRDAYWLHAYWEITPATVLRARTALEKHWRGSRPILRLFAVERGADPVEERIERDIPIHGGVSHWYIDAAQPQKSWRVAIGYLAPSGKFYQIVRSNLVTAPPDNSGADDAHWADIARHGETVFAMSGGYDPDSEGATLRDVFEAKMRRPMAQTSPEHRRLMDEASDFRFEVDAQMIVYGAAPPGSTISIAGEPLEVSPDGTFSTRLDLPDRRQVLPVVACSRDGTQQRTTVLAVERNTKVMEPMSADSDD
jgi:uncharacterized protein